VAKNNRITHRRQLASLQSSVILSSRGFQDDDKLTTSDARYAESKATIGYRPTHFFSIPGMVG
jgi:hypothetical protein